MDGGRMFVRMGVGHESHEEVGEGDVRVYHTLCSLLGPLLYGG
jgi:hypothetical protein